MQLFKLRQEAHGVSEAAGGAITHKIKLNVIIDLAIKLRKSLM